MLISDWVMLVCLLVIPPVQVYILINICRKNKYWAQRAVDETIVMLEKDLLTKEDDQF